MNNFVIIALGSNLDDRFENIQNACQKINDFSIIVQSSNIYSSTAILPKGAPKNWDMDFYNSVIAILTDLDAHQLFEKLQEVESEVNETERNKEFWSPRMMDIDIIAFNDDVIETETLTIPHERMLERSFVIFPLAEIMPDWQYPRQDIYYGRQAIEIAQDFGISFPEDIELPNNPAQIERTDLNPASDLIKDMSDILEDEKKPKTEEIDFSAYNL